MITNPGQVNGADSAMDRIFGPVGRAWDRFAAPTERWRRPFRHWRRGRPFTAGAFILLAGAEISLVTQSGLGKLLSMGIPGISTIFISVFLAVFAVTIWFYPAYRVFSGIAAIMIALLSLVATNLGGFLLGFLMAMFGGAFAVAWSPRTDYTADTRRQRRKASRLERTATQDQAVAAETRETQSTETQNTEPAEPDAEARSADPADAEGPEHSRNTQIIEHYARPDEAGQAAPEPAPEEE
jgi:hypothetical protein